MRLDDRRTALAEAMDAQGLWPADSPWVRRAILDDVPRHLFAPDTLWMWSGTAYVPVDRALQPEAWADLVYAGPYDSAITQIGDGLPTSSLSCVCVVADMADSLILEPGHRTLEVGAGMGWNAALLAHRAGPGLVTSVEVDPGLAAAARQRIKAAGLDAAVHPGDGNAGWPTGAPYDRLIATYAVERVPWTWVAQVRPGGRLVTPWGRLGHVALTVTADGESATGWVQGLGMFMPSRGVDQGRELHAIRADQPADRTSRTERNVRLRAQELGLLFSLRVTAADIRITTGEREQGFTAWLHDGVGSWATATVGPAGATVHEGGPRRLFEEVEAGWRHWEQRGAPGLFDFGMTVTAAEQIIWCRSPDSGHYG
ncbi:methyltransferase domain-containing protein [Streptomyces sp. C]|uniref:methyltransferase domain-containing protein n=1 Tax=Streptomyces sp. C TaxID=253839 RepID=UPI0001B4F287|nr:methyltransferase domain-containing protein [Streptomyces sp. C]EFL19899.1 protein-L-isoaspartate O-methyltransferase [Streptomyces sp. C]